MGQWAGTWAAIIPDYSCSCIWPATFKGQYTAGVVMMSATYGAVHQEGACLLPGLCSAPPDVSGLPFPLSSFGPGSCDSNTGAISFEIAQYGLTNPIDFAGSIAGTQLTLSGGLHTGGLNFQTVLQASK